jgi:hypothetical protein
LIDFVAEHWPQSWTKISQLMGNRSGVQCQFRYRFLTKENEPKQAVRKASPGPGPEAEAEPLLHGLEFDFNLISI